MSKDLKSGLRRNICSFIILLFAWQVLTPIASAAGESGTMACCRQVHGKKACCPQHSKERSGGPALREAGGCAGDCAAVAPTLPQFAAGSEASRFAVHADSLARVSEAFFTHTATPVSSNSFQRPPPLS